MVLASRRGQRAPTRNEAKQKIRHAAASAGSSRCFSWGAKILPNVPPPCCRASIQTSSSRSMLNSGYARASRGSSEGTVLRSPVQEVAAAAEGHHGPARPGARRKSLGSRRAGRRAGRLLHAGQVLGVLDRALVEQALRLRPRLGVHPSAAAPQLALLDAYDDPPHELGDRGDGEEGARCEARPVLAAAQLQPGDARGEHPTHGHADADGLRALRWVRYHERPVCGFRHATDATSKDHQDH
mmetsp:Transcript_88028/g.266978  ORF Transcript_88028/g.266978 Transcript_88028/m.266978 type:complete len:241 (-) Transcript_88028:489-1211(-)